MSQSHEIQVGDLVVMQRATYYEEWNESVGVVIGRLQVRYSTDLRTMEAVEILAFRVQLAEGFVVNAQPYQVRKPAGPIELELIETTDAQPVEENE